MEQKINAIIFGASGMVGQGVLWQCLASDKVEKVLLINRTALNIQNKKLKEIIHKDFTDFSIIEDQLTGFNACYFCLGISSAGMNEKDYARITYDFTLSAAKTLVNLNPEMTFCYVSGTGTDSTEMGRTMWARVKGRTENAILALPFKNSFMFRPGYIQPLHGIKSKTKLYNLIYNISWPFYPLLEKFTPNFVTDTDRVGQAMINIVLFGYQKKILENRDINELSILK